MGGARSNLPGSTRARARFPSAHSFQLVERAGALTRVTSLPLPADLQRPGALRRRSRRAARGAPRWPESSRHAVIRDSPAIWYLCPSRVECARLLFAMLLIDSWVSFSAPRLLCQIEVEIPQMICGRIIGKAGATIKEITARSSARVNIESGSNGNSVLSVSGRPEAVESARMLINNALAAPRKP